MKVSRLFVVLLLTYLTLDEAATTAQIATTTTKQITTTLQQQQPTATTTATLASTTPANLQLIVIGMCFVFTTAMFVPLCLFISRNKAQFKDSYKMLTRAGPISAILLLGCLYLPFMPFSSSYFVWFVVGFGIATMSLALIMFVRFTYGGSKKNRFNRLGKFLSFGCLGVVVGAAGVYMASSDMMTTNTSEIRQKTASTMISHVVLLLNGLYFLYRVFMTLDSWRKSTIKQIAYDTDTMFDLLFATGTLIESVVHYVSTIRGAFGHGGRCSLSELAKAMNNEGTFSCVSAATDGTVNDGSFCSLKCPSGRKSLAWCQLNGYAGAVWSHGDANPCHLSHFWAQNLTIV